ncbi:MAG: sigma-70 family RNA polymerase sigma factor [Spirochaetales bacterium]|nr:sigma-70 family RNA polymerase sigma factor [Spirochaetales bacterium]
MDFSRDLINGLKAGEENAYRELYRMTQQMLLSFILMKVNGARDTAEDILSEVYCDAFKYSKTLTLTHNVRAWLYRITRSKIADHFRRAKKQKRIITVQSASTREKEARNLLTNAPEAEVLKKENQIMFSAAFKRLPVSSRNLLRLRYIEEKSMKEIAASLNKTEKAVENILYRTKKEFINEIKNMSREKIYS